MNIKELKDMIASLPDDMLVVNCHDGEVSMFTDRDPDISVGSVYIYALKDYYSAYPKTIEYSSYYGGGVIHSTYQALIIHTQA